jgi:ABC-type transporter Mla MlaB component
MAVGPADVKTILLAGPITLYEVSALRETMRSALAERKHLRVDLRDSGPWDLAGLQLLISFDRTASDRDREVHLINVPRVCADIAERSGLTGWLRAAQG